jgi:hypothetical protein
VYPTLYQSFFPPDDRSLSKPPTASTLSHSLNTMRFFAVLAVFSATFATTSAALLEQRQTGYASCALPCLTSTNPGSCALDDTSCLCHDQDFVNQATVCFQNSCSGDDLQKSIAAAVAMCQAVGVTLTTTPISTPTSSSHTSTPTSSPTSSGSNSGSNKSSGVSNGVNVLFALSALGLIGYAL